MPPPLPESVRAMVIEAVAAGVPAREAARRCGVSVSSAIKWAQRWRRSGSFLAGSSRGTPRSKLHHHTEFLLDLVRANPALTLAAVQAALRERGMEAALSSVWRFFDRHGIRLSSGVRGRPRTRAPAAAKPDSAKPTASAPPRASSRRQQRPA